MRPIARVLVVDDEPVVISSCRRVLTQAGYEVDTSDSGREGMRRALAEDFDLVLTDIKMPDVDGMELARTLRNERPGTAVVIITGYGSVRSAVEATKFGVSDYIEKPFTPEEIAGAARRALGPVRREREVRVEAETVRKVLRMASQDRSFGESLMREGSRVLSGYALSWEAKAAIVSGDIAWIEKECGELSDEEREWLQGRLEAEIW